MHRSLRQSCCVLSLALAAVAGVHVASAAAQNAPVTGTLATEGMAAATPDAGALTGKPSVVIPRAPVRPNVDGNLDDAAWKTAAHLDTFVQQRPRENTAATELTDVYISYDDKNLYFGIYAHYSVPASMRVNRSERDRVFRDDVVSIMFDPFLDQQRAYVFSVNGYGVQSDSLMGGRGGGGGGGGGDLGDRSWNALYSSAGHPVTDGWTAELSIPFKSLRYPSRKEGEAHRWGFQIQRDIQGKNESDVWSPVMRNVASFLGQMGTLDGMTNLSMSHNLELLPTVTGVRSQTFNTATGETGDDNQPEAGLNLKYGLTSNLTLDFTANPDFSQIESDQPQITTNQRFPVFYPELRPFFLEGQEIFDVSGPVTFVHTRTIVDPQYGAKLTGKIGKTTIGVLAANDIAPGKTSDLTDPLYGDKAQSVFGRARYDLYSESYIGGIVTDREIDTYFSRAGGIDSRFKIGEKHRFEALTFFSDQLSANSDDPGAHQGNMYNVSFRRDGRGWNYFVATNGVSPGFRNDSGFVRRTDYRETFGNLSYRWYPESWVVNWGPRGGYSKAYDYAGTLQDESRDLGVNAQLARNINLNGNISREMEHYVGADFWKNRYFFNANINSSRRASVNFGMSGGDELNHDEADARLGSERRYNVNFNLRPLTRLSETLMINTGRLLKPEGGDFYNVKVIRSITSFQLSDRWTLRGILERNTDNRTFSANVLGTYRVNSGTAFFIGYDDHYKQGDQIDGDWFNTSKLQRTNRALFTKLQYLFRL